MATTGRSPDEALAELVRSNPQRRLVLPTEVADAVAWLCSPGSSAITGVGARGRWRSDVERRLHHEPTEPHRTLTAERASPG